MRAKRSLSTPSPKGNRRGYSLLELTMSVIVLMAAMSLTVKVLGWVGMERRAADRRLWAIQEMGNVMERVAGEPFDKLTKASVESLTTEGHLERVLPGALWEVGVVDDDKKALTSKRVTIGLRWKERAGGWEAPLTLTTWVYAGRKPS